MEEKVKSIIARIEENFVKFEKETNKLFLKISALAKNSIREDFEKFKEIEKEKSDINKLKEELNTKKTYSDVDIQGIKNIEDEIARREKQLKDDENKLLFGNAFMQSAISFEKELLSEIENKTRLLHALSTSLQIQIVQALEFIQQNLKNAQINTLDLNKKSMTLAETNANLLQSMMYLTSIKFNSLNELENYMHEKNMILSRIKNNLETEEFELKDMAKNIASYYFSDLERTKIG